MTKAGRERRYHHRPVAPDWSLHGGARGGASELRQLIDQGGDPLADIEAERAAPTVAELADRFEQEHLPRKRAATADDYRRMLDEPHPAALRAHTKVADVIFTDVDALHRKITKSGGHYAANRVVAVLWKMFSSAIRWNMRETIRPRASSAISSTAGGATCPLRRAGALVKALADYADQQAADIVRLLLLTGARRGEVLAMRWADLDLRQASGRSRQARPSRRRTTRCRCQAPARQLLSEIRERQAGKRHALGEYVFPGTGDSGHVVEIKKAWRPLCRAAGITGLRIHDLRHSYASQLVSGGASLPLIGALLGHASPIDDGQIRAHAH